MIVKYLNLGITLVYVVTVTIIYLKAVKLLQPITQSLKDRSDD
jgi:hypothetical protein